MRYLPVIGVALGIVALIVLVFPLVQTQRHLREVRTELGKTNEQLVQERGATAELEGVVANLKAELDAANRARTEFKENLDDANSDMEQLRSDLDAAQSQLREGKAELSESETQIGDLKKQLATTTTDRDAAQSKLGDTQSQLEGLNSELAKAKEAAEQANTKATELENAVNSANAEIGRLKGELEQRSPPPVTVSPPENDSSTPQIEQLDLRYCHPTRAPQARGLSASRFECSVLGQGASTLGQVRPRVYDSAAALH